LKCSPSRWYPILVAIRRTAPLKIQAVCLSQCSWSDIYGCLVSIDKTIQVRVKTLPERGLGPAKLSYRGCWISQIEVENVLYAQPALEARSHETCQVVRDIPAHPETR
jgi:hypothetical protein